MGQEPVVGVFLEGAMKNRPKHCGCLEEHLEDWKEVSFEKHC